MIITCSRTHLEEICRKRGYSFFRAAGCVVSSVGDIIAVDTEHADYPRENGSGGEKDPSNPLE
jgi:hypothetical protein